MAQLPNGPFDATQVDPDAGNDPIPAGTYLMHIVASEMKLTASGSGQYLKLEMEVLDGPHARRKVWDNLNILHHKKDVADRAYATLSAVARATGKGQFSDSAELHNLPFTARVKVTPARGEYEAGNAIAKYLPAGTAAPGGTVNGTAAMPATAAPPAAPPAPAQGAAPWRTGG